MSNKTCNDFLEQTLEVLKQREGEHGDKQKCFDLIGAYWSIYLGHPVTALDVAAMMDLLKTARFQIGNKQNPDHYLDKLGYTSIIGELARCE